MALTLPTERPYEPKPAGTPAANFQRDKAVVLPDVGALIAASAAGSYTNHDANWMGCTTETAYVLARDGWPEAVQAALGIFDRLSATKMVSLVTPLTYAEMDGDVDVSAYLSGEDECFVVTTSTPRVMPGRGALRIKVSPLLTWSYSAEKYAAAGIAICALVAIAERAGMPVEVELHTPPESGLEVRCVLKYMGEPLDLPKLVYWLAHPSVLRQHLHSIKAQIADRAGYACDCPAPADEQEVAVDYKAAGSDPERWLLDTLKANGLEVM